MCTYSGDGGLGRLGVDVGAVTFQLIQDQANVVVIDQLHQHLNTSQVQAGFLLQSSFPLASWLRHVEKFSHHILLSPSLTGNFTPS